MSVFRWRYDETCEGRYCCGDCDKCDKEDEPVDGLISRQAAIEEVMNHYRVGDKPQNEEMDWCAKMLHELPSAEKKGKWVEFANEDGELDLKCSVCGEEQGFYFGYFNFCPNCGARMEE